MFLRDTYPRKKKEFAAVEEPPHPYNVAYYYQHSEMMLANHIVP